MRAILATIVALAALWRFWVDWDATIGTGYAYRFGSIGGAISEAWPESYGHLVDSLQHSGVPFLWNPVGALMLSVPLALLLAALAAALWVTRERRLRR